MQFYLSRGGKYPGGLIRPAGITLFGTNRSKPIMSYRQIQQLGWEYRLQIRRYGTWIIEKRSGVGVYRWTTPSRYVAVWVQSDFKWSAPYGRDMFTLPGAKTADSLIKH